MPPILSYRDLVVWQRGMQLMINIYRATETFPVTERFGLTAQMRRAALSIPTNLAEGHTRGGGAYLNHLRIALGSQAELSTEIEAARRLGMLLPGAADTLDAQLTEVRLMLYGLLAALERRRAQSGDTGHTRKS